MYHGVQTLVYAGQQLSVLAATVANLTNRGPSATSARQQFGHRLPTVTGTLPDTFTDRVTPICGDRVRVTEP